MVKMCSLCLILLTKQYQSQIRKKTSLLPLVSVRVTKIWKKETINTTKQRLKGLCPRTPRETAVFLEANEFSSDTRIYIVAGEIHGHDGIKALKAKYPNSYSHFSLAKEEQLSLFKDCQNQLAAEGYIVAVESDVFVHSDHVNMAKAVTDHRKYEGFRKNTSTLNSKITNLF